MFERFLFGIVNGYETFDNKIIFKYYFNKNPDDKLKEIMNNHEIIIFADYTNLKQYKQSYFNEKTGSNPKYWEGSRFNKVLELQPNTKKLYLGNDFNNKIIFNYKLEFILFGFNYNKTTKFSENILKAIFPHMSLFNSEIVLNNKLEYLELGSDFNNNIKLNENLKYLRTGICFNQNLMLNTNLINLYFGEKFNQPIQLNDKLETLMFGKKFNQPFQLNNNLVNLYLGNEFNQKLVVHNTSKLKYLFLGEDFTNDLYILGENIYCITMTETYNNNKNILFGKNIIDSKKISTLKDTGIFLISILLDKNVVNTEKISSLKDDPINLNKIYGLDNEHQINYDKEKYIHVLFTPI